MKMRTGLTALVAFIATQALAQTTTVPLDPNDSKVAVPPVNYRSAFANYRTFRDEKVSDWKSANDAVGQIGGWRVYAREASQPEPVAVPATPASPPRSATGDKPPVTPASGRSHQGH